MICWVLSGLVIGIVLADIWPSMLTGWLLLSAGCLTFYIFAKKFALVLLFVSIGILLSVPRLVQLPDATGYYGQENRYTVRSMELMQSTQEYMAWQGEIVEPGNLAGTRLVIYSDNFSPGIYTLAGRLNPPIKYRNPGQDWHYKRKLYSGEIGSLSSPRVIEFQPVQPDYIERLRDRFRTNLYNNLSEDSAALALAVTTGDRSIFTTELKSSVYQSGVGHIMALSGLHVAIITGLLLLLARKIGFSKVAASVLAFVAVCFYVLFVGPSPSLIRAVLMSGFGLGAVLTGREKHGLTALYWIAVIMLLYNPLWVFDYAFVFSFLATFVCLKAGNRLEKYLPFLPGPMKRAASITLIIQLAALPLNLYLFRSVSLWAPLANILVLPLLPIMFAASLAAGVFSGFWGAFAKPAELLLNGVCVFLKLLNRFPLTIELGGLRLILAGAFSLILILSLSGAGKKFIAVGIALCLLLVPAYRAGQDLTCSVWFLDVGQGDSILIRRRSQWILVDTGDQRAGEGTVVPTLKYLGVNCLDAVIITHPHADHAGGLQAVLDSFPVRRLLVNPSYPSSEWAECAEYTVVRGTEIASAGVLVYSHDRLVANLNDTSLLASVQFNKIGILITGDIEAEGESLYYNRIDVHQVLKVAHHGSNSSTSRHFLAKVRPETAVISCGLGNRYGMPGLDAIGNLELSGADTYRTDLAGCIHLTVWPWADYSVISFARR